MLNETFGVDQLELESPLIDVFLTDTRIAV